MVSELDWTLAYSTLSKSASAEEIEEMARAYARIACHACVHANVCTRSEGPSDICHEFMLGSEMEKLVARPLTNQQLYCIINGVREATR